LRRLEKAPSSSSPTRHGANPTTARRKAYGKTGISRASTIDFLEQLAREGILEKWGKSGRGGFHGIYRLSLSETQLREHLI